MSLLRFLGLGGDRDGSRSQADSRTVHRIASQLERLEPEKARFLAAFAYVLARVANADLQVDADETAEMESQVRELAGLGPEEAALVVEIAKSQNRLLGGTENYVVTREFREISSQQERLRLVTCLYAVAAADGGISTAEDNEIRTVGEELGLTRPEINAVRASFRDRLDVFKGMPGAS